MKLFFHFIVFTLNVLALFSTPIWANASVQIDPEVHNSYQLFPHFELFEDTEGGLKIEQIDSLDFANRFRMIHPDERTLKYNGSVYWLRFPITNSLSSKLHLILDTNTCFIDNVKIYQSLENGRFISKENGQFFPRNRQDLKTKSITFELILPPGINQYIYLRLENKDYTKIDFTLWDFKAFISKENKALFGLGLFYGLLLILIVYNFVIYLIVKEISYLYYVLATITMFFTQMSIDGLDILYIWPSFPELSRPNSFISLFGQFVFLALFTKSFLETKRFTPAWDSILSFSIFVQVAGCIAVFFIDRPLSYELAYGISTLMLFLFYACGIAAFFKGSPMAKYYIFIYSFGFIGNILLILEIVGIIQGNFFINLGHQLGLAVEYSLFSLGLAYRFKLIRDERDKAYLQSIKSEKKFRQLLESEEKAIVGERHRIAREIHDGLAQNLVYMRFKAKLWHKIVDDEPSKMHKELDTFRELLKDSIREVRRSIFALRPISLEENGFQKAVMQFLAEFQEQFQIQFHVTMTDSLRNLPQLLELIFFRIIQESINNIVKHANASTVSIELKLIEGRQIVLKIRDNGCGFDPANLADKYQNGHLGIHQMQERVKQINGEFEVKSQEGEGVQILTRLPCSITQ